MKKVTALVLILMLIPLVAFADSNRIFDNAGLFSETDVVILNAAIEVFQRQTHLDFALLTTDDYLGTDNHKLLADTFYDSQGFGLDGVHSGMLMYIDMNQRLQYISTTGNLIALLDEDNIENVLDISTPLLLNGAYKDGVLETIKFVTEINTAYWNALFSDAKTTP